MSKSRKQGMSTRSIHGHGFRDAHGSPHLPVYYTTTFSFDSTADLLDVVEGRKPGNCPVSKARRLRWRSVPAWRPNRRCS